jgi:hypothetical protein
LAATGELAGEPAAAAWKADRGCLFTRRRPPPPDLSQRFRSVQPPVKPNRTGQIRVAPANMLKSP